MNDIANKVYKITDGIYSYLKEINEDPSLSPIDVALFTSYLSGIAEACELMLEEGDVRVIDNKEKILQIIYSIKLQILENLGK